VISNNRLLISYIRLMISNIRLLISNVVLLLITIVRLLISTILVMISILSLISTIGLTAGRTLILSQQTGQETCGGGWCIPAPPVVAVVVVEEGPHEKGPDHTHPQAHHRSVDRRVVGEDPGAGGLGTVLQDNGLRVLLDIAILQRDVEQERDEEVYLRQLHYSTFSLQP